MGLVSRVFGISAAKSRSLRLQIQIGKGSGFWEVELTKRAQDLSAFIAPNGQFLKLKVMPFGLTNAPATSFETWPPGPKTFTNAANGPNFCPT